MKPPTPGPLSARIIVLAETPDDASIVDDLVAGIGPLAAELVEPARYASVTAHREGGLTTVSVSGELARAVDEAQYAADDGPCVAALRETRPVHLADLPSTMDWPDFRTAAVSLGLRSSLSIPLRAGSGRAVASLNLYSPVAGAFIPLAEHITDRGTDPLEPGSAELVAGLAEAADILRVIRRAVGVLTRRDRSSPEEAYLALRMSAADNGVPLTEAALAIAGSERRS